MVCIFTCYDVNQKKYFEENGERNLIYGLHPKTYKRFWVYERNEHFNQLLDEWIDKTDKSRSF